MSSNNIKVQKANVAGQFYLANGVALKKMVNILLEENPDKTDSDKTSVQALVIPHAGHIYSGAVAATAYSKLKKLNLVDPTIAILSPSHVENFEGVVASDATHFETPLGKVAVAQDIVGSLCTLPFVKLRNSAFEGEHALEVHLPFLQTLFADFKLVPLIVGRTEPDVVAELISVLNQKFKIFIIVSSDLSHFHSYEEAQKKDRCTAQLIEKKDYQSLHGEDACGIYPLRGLLKWAQNKQLLVTTLDLRNSGDSAGDRRRVVGYGAFCVSAVTS